MRIHRRGCGCMPSESTSRSGTPAAAGTRPGLTDPRVVHLWDAKDTSGAWLAGNVQGLPGRRLGHLPAVRARGHLDQRAEPSAGLRRSGLQTGSSSSARRWTRSSPHPGKPQEEDWREGRGIEAGAGSPNLPLGVCGCWAGVSWTALGVARPSSYRALQDQRAGPAQTPWDQPSCNPEHTSALAPGSQPTGHRQLRNPKSKRLLSQQTSRPRQGCSQEVAQQF